MVAANEVIGNAAALATAAHEHSSFLEQIKGYGGYSTSIVLIITALLGWWKVLPSLIDSLANRQSNIEARMGKLLDDAQERFTKQLADADRRHDDCMDGQNALHETCTAQSRRINEQDDQIAEMKAVIEGLRRQVLQMQRSAVRIEGQHPNPVLDAIIDIPPAAPPGE